MEKLTKIEAAINDTKLRKKKVEQDIMLLCRERDVLQEQLDMLDAIKHSKEYE